MLKIGDIVIGKVVYITKTHILAELKNKKIALVHVSEISDYFVPKISAMFKMNEKYYFEVIDLGEKNKVKLSWKRLKPRFLKDPFEFELEEVGAGFELLWKNTIKEIEKND